MSWGPAGHDRRRDDRRDSDDLRDDIAAAFGLDDALARDVVAEARRRAADDEYGHGVRTWCERVLAEHRGDTPHPGKRTRVDAVFGANRRPDASSTPGQVTRAMTESALRDVLRGLRNRPAPAAASRPRPVDAAVQARLAGLLPGDLAAVRVHVDSPEPGRAQAISRDGELHFRPGAYQPGTRDGDWLIAHELVHAVQQQRSDGRIGSRAEIEREADVAASRVSRGMRATVSLRAPAGAAYAFDDDEHHDRAADDDAAPGPAATADDAGAAEEAAPRPASVADDSAESADAVDSADGADSADSAADPAVAVDDAAAGAPAATQRRPGPVAAADDAGAPAPARQHSSAPDAAPVVAPSPRAEQAPAAPQSSPDLGAAIGGNPAVNELAAQVRIAARTEKEALQRTINDQRARMQRSVDSGSRQLEQDGVARLDTLLAGITARRAEVATTFATARSQIAQRVAAHKQLARDEGTAALAAVRRATADAARDAVDAARDEAGLMEAAGRRESRRATASVATTAAALREARNAAGAGYAASDERVRRAVRDAMARTTRDIVDGVRAKASEVSRGASEVATRIARATRDAGARLAASFGDHAGDAETAIRDGTATAVDRIDGLGAEALERLTTLEASATAALDRARDRSAPLVQAATRAAVDRLRSAGTGALASLESQEAATLAEIDRATSAALATLTGIGPEQSIADDAAASYLDQARSALRQAGSAAGDAFARQVATVQTGVDQVRGGFAAAVDDGVATVTAELDRVMVEVRTASEQPAVVDAACEQVRTDVGGVYRTASDELTAQTRPAIADARRDWRRQRTRAEHEITRIVDDLVAGNAALARAARGRFRQTARDAADSAGRSLAGRIWDGVVSGLRIMWDGLKWMLLGLLVVVVVLALLVIAGVITAAIAVEVLIAVVVVAGLYFLIRGLYEAARHRFGAAWRELGNRPWYERVAILIVSSPYHLALVVGDVLGVTPIVEGIVGYDATTLEELTPEQRAERITMGVLTILTFLLLHRAGRALGRGARSGRTPVANEGQPQPQTPLPQTPLPENGVPETPLPENALPANAPPENAPPENAPPPTIEPETRPRFQPHPSHHQLHRDRDSRPRPGETQAQARARVDAAGEELLPYADALMEALGDRPRRISIRAEEPARTAQGAHTIRNHGSDIPLRTTDNPGGKSIEGRVTNPVGPGWQELPTPENPNPAPVRPTNSSSRWISDSVMHEVVNDYVAANWALIRAHLAIDGRYSVAFDAGSLVGEGFVNEGMNGFGPRTPRYVQTSLVRLVLVLDLGPPPSYFVSTAFPNYLGTPAY